MPRGYYGIGIHEGKTPENMGLLWRTAFLYDAAFIFTIGQRYSRRASDTPNTPRHIPLFEFATFDDFLAASPVACPLVGVELDPRAVPLSDYTHPERACYLLGAEDRGLPLNVLDRCDAVVQIEAAQPWSMNVAVAGSLILHHRHTSRTAVLA